MEQSTLVNRKEETKQDRPRYEAPRLQQISEREILNSFQITQSMAGWWTNPTCC